MVQFRCALAHPARNYGKQKRLRVGITNSTVLSLQTFQYRQTKRLVLKMPHLDRKIEFYSETKLGANDNKEKQRFERQ